MDTVVNRAVSSLHGWSLEIKLTVPLKVIFLLIALQLYLWFVCSRYNTVDTFKPCFNIIIKPSSSTQENREPSHNSL